METTAVLEALLYDETIKQRRLRAELRPGRRWIWWGKRGWWLRCFLLHDQHESWHRHRFVTTVAEACTWLHVQADDWTWRPVTLKDE
jgi:hypothetical protein